MSWRIQGDRGSAFFWLFFRKLPRCFTWGLAISKFVPGWDPCNMSNETCSADSQSCTKKNAGFKWMMTDDGHWTSSMWLIMIDQLSKAVLEETGDISSQSHLLISTVGWDLCGPWRQQEGYCGCVNHLLNMGKPLGWCFSRFFQKTLQKNWP